jgi:two-component sensor histidine kinase
MRFVSRILLTFMLLLTGAIGAPAQTAGAVASVRRQATQFLRDSRLAQDQHHYLAAKAAAQKAIDAYATLDEPDSLGEAFVMFWSASTLDGLPYRDRIPLLEKASAAFEKANNGKRRGDCLKEIADLQQLTGDYPAAMLNLQNALRLYQSVRYPNLQGVYDLLCTVANSLNEYDESVRYGLLAIRTAEGMQDTSLSMCTYYGRLGYAYYMLRDFEKAGLYFRKSLDIARKYNDPNGITTLGINITRLYIYWNRPRQALDFLTTIYARYPDFFHTAQFEVDANLLLIYDRLDPAGKGALYCAVVENDLARMQLRDLKRVMGYNNLLNHYFTIHDYKKANTWRLAYGNLVRQLKVPSHIQNDLQWQFRLDSAQGNYISAIRHYQQFKASTDTTLNLAKSRQIEQYNALYESEKKDKSILLLSQQSEIQQASLRHEQFLSRVTLGGIALLMIIIGLLYYTVRTKQRGNRMLEAQRAEIDRKNQSLQRLVTEKEWLVKEIHHRVKNNLHMVVGLLASQAEYLKGQEAYEAITESQHRVQAMSLIHQKLYNTENLSTIHMPHYVRELVDYLESSFNTERSIRFTLDIAKVSFPLSHSIPIGLILNEAITNAIKYAFPGRSKGLIDITLRETTGAEPQFVLQIRDDGIGIPADRRQHSSLGLLLIEGLSRDINGSLTIINDNGTHITLSFPVPKAVTAN